MSSPVPTTISIHGQSTRVKHTSCVTTNLVEWASLPHEKNFLKGRGRCGGCSFLPCLCIPAKPITRTERSDTPA